MVKQACTTMSKMYETQNGFNGVRLACDAIFKKMKTAAIVEAQRSRVSG